MVSQQTVIFAGFGPVFETNGNALSTEQGLLAMGAMFSLVGFVVVYASSGGYFRKTRQYLGLGTLGADGGNDIAVAGTIADGETIRGPMSEADCVLYEDETQALRRDWKYDREERIEMEQKDMFDEKERERKVTKWHTVSMDRESVPFALDTSYGTVTVDPEDAEVDIPVKTTDQSSFLRRFVHRMPLIGYLGKYTGIVGNPKRRMERHLTPGDQVLVIGDAETGDTTEQTATVDSGRNLFLITTRSRWNLAIRNFIRGFFVSIPGLIAILIGLVFLLGAAVAAGIL